jgi:hypothetical protein
LRELQAMKKVPSPFYFWLHLESALRSRVMAVDKQASFINNVRP